MVAVDANIILRIFTRDDAELAAKATGILQNAKTGSLLVDRLIMAEISYVLKGYYQIEKSKIARVLEALLKDDRFYIVDRELIKTTVALFQKEKPLSFEDCWLLALQRSGRVDSVATFDHKLEKRLIEPAR